MTPEHQALLDAFRGVMNEAIAPLTTSMEGLETRMEGLETRMEGLETRMEGLETRVETIDVRTSQMSNDLLDLRDRVPLLEERVDNGFRALKSDLNFAFSDSRKASLAHDRNDKAIEGLRREIASIQQRLSALEHTKDDS
jgi:chromosome segregation ATPase